LGNIRDVNLVKLWQEHETLLTLRSKKVKGKCSDCEYREECLGCRGRAYELTGDFMAEDPGCWIK